MDRRRSNEQQAIQKRNAKRLRQYFAAFPEDITLSGIPDNFLESQVSTSIMKPPSVEEVMEVSDCHKPSDSHDTENESESDDTDEKDIYYNNVYDQELIITEQETNDNNTDECEISNISQNNNTSRDPALYLGDNVGLEMNLFPKENVTVKDHILVEIAIAIKNNTSYEGILDRFRWMKVANKYSIIPTSKSALWKLLSRTNNSFTHHYYCGLCTGYVGVKSEATQDITVECPCSTCGPNKPNTHLHYFLKMNISAQIQHLFETSKIVQLLRYRQNRHKKNEDACEDLLDGLEYKELSAEGKFLNNKYNFSFTLNTDGCQVTNSSNTSAWPIYLQFNELPPYLRKKYMILAAIHVDKSHPLMNVFLRPVIDEIKQLYKDGIKWKHHDSTIIISKFIVTNVSVDLPARASLTRMIYFNGENSCLYCYSKGKSYGRGKFGFSMKENDGILRTNSEVTSDMNEAYQLRKIIRGFKGVSCLIALPLFKFCSGIVVEGMHSVYLGVIKQHTGLLLDSTHSEYYIGNPTNRTLIDRYLLSIKPPSQRSRTPRSISTCKKWKASEWRNWLGYAPICLQGILQDKYIEHIANLAEAIHYLNNDTITSEQLDKAENLLQKYIENFEIYFGPANMTHNVHLMTHLAKNVRNWGPIWAHSAFGFESWNKKIIDTVTSPHCRAEQIATPFLMNHFIHNSIHDSSVSEEARSYVSKLLNITDSGSSSAINYNRSRVKLSSKVTTRAIINEEKQILQEMGYEPDSLNIYKKMTVNGVEFACKDDKTQTNFSNSTVCSSENNFGEILNIFTFIHNENIVIICILELYKVISSSFNTEYIYEVEATSNFEYIRKIESLQPVVKVRKPTKTYVFPLSNCWESD